MAFRFVALACFVACAQAGVIAPVAHYAAAPVAHYAAAPVAHYAAAPVAHYAAAPVAHYAPHEEQYAPAEYSFEYSVHDEHTGDIKSQKEVRHGDSVQGSYSLVEPDGTHRVVEYTADEHNGFNAVVHREPSQHAHAIVKPVLKVAAPVAHYAAAPVAHYAAAPVAHYAAAPVAHYAAAPVAHYAHAAPVAHYAAAPVAHYAQAAPAHSYYHH